MNVDLTRGGRAAARSRPASTSRPIASCRRRCARCSAPASDNAAVTVRYTRRGIELEVTGDAAVYEDHEAEVRLLGTRERIALFGGELHAGRPPRRRLGPARAAAAAGGSGLRTRDIVVGVALAIAVIARGVASARAATGRSRQPAGLRAIGLLFLAQPLRLFELTLALFVAMSARQPGGDRRRST